MVMTIGFPKAGVHALVKACRLLGLSAQVAHDDYSPEVEGPVVYTKRDPRNMICSWLRFHNHPVTPGTFLSLFNNFYSFSLLGETPISYIDRLAKHEGWLTRENTLVVRFEDLIASDVTMREIAAFCGVPYIDGSWEALPGMTLTYRQPHSDYTTIWTPQVEDAWNAGGGPALLERWGY